LPDLLVRLAEWLPSRLLFAAQADSGLAVEREEKHALDLRRPSLAAADEATMSASEDDRASAKASVDESPSSKRRDAAWRFLFELMRRREGGNLLLA
jgi:hypothetical protein